MMAGNAPASTVTAMIVPAISRAVLGLPPRRTTMNATSPTRAQTTTAAAAAGTQTSKMVTSLNHSFFAEPFVSLPVPVTELVELRRKRHQHSHHTRRAPRPPEVAHGTHTGA